ncbi:MAG: DUF2634 domain-containing protein [Alicyclobacillus sp.]|nr:DUF2634 domain-containing protein [Alicyclobacillus sp.]
MSLGKPHILSVTEVQRGIQALAALLLGDASEWLSLVQANNLLPPYITTNPSEIYGPPVAIATLSGPVSAEATTIHLPNQPQSTNRLYLSSSGASGMVAEGVGVRSYDGVTFTLSTPLKNSYRQGTQVQLFSAYTASNTQVLLPGDVIFIPVQTNSFALSSTGQLTDVFGSDIAVPVSFQSGDVDTVQGLATLKQRAQAALQTMVNSMPLHMDWGSRLLTVVGQSATRTQWSVLIRECLLKLPEITNVEDASATPSGDRVYINATVYTSTSDAAIQFEGLSLTIVGSSQ